MLVFRLLTKVEDVDSRFGRKVPAQPNFSHLSSLILHSRSLLSIVRVVMRGRRRYDWLVVIDCGQRRRVGVGLCYSQESY